MVVKLKNFEIPIFFVVGFFAPCRGLEEKASF